MAYKTHLSSWLALKRSADSRFFTSDGMIQAMVCRWSQSK